jgi:hypothetical protein
VIGQGSSSRTARHALLNATRIVKNTRKDIMAGNHAHEYVGRHRKPDEDQTGRCEEPRERLRPTYELFTHGTQPIAIPKEK